MWQKPRLRSSSKMERPPVSSSLSSGAIPALLLFYVTFWCCRDRSFPIKNGVCSASPKAFQTKAGALEPWDQRLTPSWANFFTRGFLAVSIIQRRGAISAPDRGLGDEQEDTKKTEISSGRLWLSDNYTPGQFPKEIT